MPSVCSFQLRNWILTELWPFVPEVVAMGVKGQHGAEPWTGIGRHGRCPSFKCRRGCGTRWKLLQNTKIIQKYISLNYNNLFLKTNVLRCNDVHVIHFFFLNWTFLLILCRIDMNSCKRQKIGVVYILLLNVTPREWWWRD